MNLFEILLLIDILRLLPLFAVFGYAAYQDYKTGEVSDKTWIYAFIGFPLMLIEYLFLAPNILPIAFATIGTCTAIAYLLIKLNKNLKIDGWGEADSLAIVTLAVCYPLAPAYLAWLPLYPMMIFAVASTIAVIAMLIRGIRRIRFLPYVAVGLVIVALL